jgi:hypothetical protein
MNRPAEGSGSAAPAATRAAADALDEPRLGRSSAKEVVTARRASYDSPNGHDRARPPDLRRLEDHPWQAADLFRYKISNQKDYILALLFFKRASDLYEEELSAALDELGDVPNARSSPAMAD